MLNLQEAETTVTRIGFAAGLASGLVTAIVGMAGPAYASAPRDDSHHVFDLLSDPKGYVDHLRWLDEISPKVNVPKVDTTAQLSR
jgi:hypothetical protein